MTDERTKGSPQCQIGFLGCGEMGSMVLDAAIEAGVFQPDSVLIAEHDQAKQGVLKNRGFTVVDSSTELKDCDQLVLAVRPQQFAEAAAGLEGHDRPRLVVSVMAGIGSAFIRKKLGDHARVICVMPNAPVRVHAGMSVVMPAPEATPEDIQCVESIFQTLGLTVQLAESSLWAVTALSGSGPGYVSLFAEAMLETAIRMGLDSNAASTLVAQTLVGTGRMLIESGVAPAALRASVTTPGGTTEAAIASMIEAGVPGAIGDGIQAAHDRGESLSAG